jgi:hypothetical protein
MRRTDPVLIQSPLDITAMRPELKKVSGGWTRAASTSVGSNLRRLIPASAQIIYEISLQHPYV